MLISTRLVYFVLLCVSLTRASRGPEGMLYRSCLMGYGITGISSNITRITEGDQTLVDRKWNIACGRISYQTEGEFCQWGYEFANRLQGRLRWKCPLKNGYLTGIYSEYVPDKQDRLWRMECCNSTGVRLENCRRDRPRKDKDVRRPGAPVYVNLTRSVVQTIRSKYYRNAKDRLWNFVICDYSIQYKGRLQKNDQ